VAQQHGNVAYRSAGGAAPADLATSAPDPASLDETDQAVLNTVARAQAGQGAQGTNEPGGFIYADGDAPVNYGSPGSVDRGSVQDAHGAWATAGWHGHPPFAGDVYSLSNGVNYSPSLGDRLQTYTTENQQLRNAGILGPNAELREEN
jgi:hypothetical protein